MKVSLKAGASPLKVLVTRAEPAATRTRLRLEALGYDPLIFPIFDLVDTGEVLPEGHYDGVVFTSANAVEVLARRQWRPHTFAHTAYCVGKRTAEAAMAIGFEHCISASGGGAALCARINELNLPKGHRFFYPTTPDRSFDMQKHLGALGYLVDSANIYQTRKVLHSKDDVQNVIRACKNGAILVYSARSADYLAELVSAGDVLPELSSISLVGISKSATNIMLKFPWQNVYVSSDPDEETMLSMLDIVSSA